VRSLSDGHDFALRDTGLRSKLKSMSTLSDFTLINPLRFHRRWNNFGEAKHVSVHPYLGYK
jgi:beta-xylosidase